MKKFKSIVIAALCFVLGASLSLAGTFAFLKDETDTAYNVMTNGNVKIQQLEYERVVDENGKWVSAPQYNVTFGSDTYTPDLLQKFTQGKPLYPAVYNNANNTMAWDDRNGSQAGSGKGSHQQGWAQVGAPGSNQLFDDSVANVIDKFVFVKNTGKYDAYVRTIFAFEAGNLSLDELDKMIHVNTSAESNWNMSFETEDLIPVTIEGVNYFLVVATYVRNGGILTPGETTRPSLLQFYLDPSATNETVESFGDTYDILVISQATQTEGFIDVDGDGMIADDALDRTFGTVTSLSHPWSNKSVNVPNIANDADELLSLLEKGGNVVVYGQLDANKTGVVPGWSDNNTYEYIIMGENGPVSLSGGELVMNEGAKYGIFAYTNENETVDISDMKIVSDSQWTTHLVNYGGRITVTNVDITAKKGAGFYAYGTGTTILNNVKINHEALDDAYAASTPWAATAVAASNEQIMVINGGTYVGTTCGVYVYNSGATITINGGSFKAPVVLKADGGYSATAAAGRIVVNGGNFDGKIERNNGRAYIEINGGNFTNFSVDSQSWCIGELVIKGGTFDSDPSAYVPEGYVAVENTSMRSAAKTYTVKPIADEVTFRAAIEKLDNIKLMGNVTLDADTTITVVEGAKKVVDLNGYTISCTSEITTANREMFSVLGNLTVKNGKVTLLHTGADMGINYEANIFYVGGSGTLNLDKVTAENLGGSYMAYCVDLRNAKNVTLNVTESTLKSTYIPVRVFNNASGANNVNITSSTLSGKYAFWTQYYLDDGRTAEQLEETLNYNIFNGTNTLISTAQPNFPVIAGLNVTYYFMNDGEAANGASTAKELQDLLDKAVDGDYIVFNGNIEGNVTLTQKNGVSITVDGMGNSFKGVFTVFGNGVGNDAGTGLVIKNVDFIAANGAESCIVSPDKTLNNKYSYSTHVTVDSCTFTDPDGTVDCAAIRHEDGGDWYWTIKNCTIDSTIHSLIQTNNVHGKLLIDNCKVYSKNGANFHSCTNVEVVNSTFDVKGYALRFGPKSGGDPDATKTVLVKNNTLKSAENDGDTVIVFRAAVNNMTLTLEGNTIVGTEMSGNVDLVNIVRK